MKFYTNAIESGDEILLRGYENGRAISRRVKYEPTLFFPGKVTSQWKTMYGRPLEPMTFESMREAKKFIKNYENVDNFEIFGLPRFVYSFLNEEYPGEVLYDRDLIRVVNIDIEVASKHGFPNVETAQEEITAITLKKNGTFFVFGCGDFTTTRQDIKYVKCRNEKELLIEFLQEWVRGGHPDVVTGWNIAFFDIPYMKQRFINVLGETAANKLSPWKFFHTRTVRILGKENTSISIAGISTLDYLEMYRKFTYTQQESYRLDNIAHVELGERKIDYSEYETLHMLYEKDYQKFIEYNIRDVEIVDKLDDKMKLIEMVYALAYDAKVNMGDVFTQVRMWDVLIHNHLWDKKVAVPMNTDGKKDSAYEGAYVKDPKVGMSQWVMSFDLNSLYPHLIMQYNISPETITNKKIDISVAEILDKNHEIPLLENHSLAPNGCYFNNSKQGFLPEMMERMYGDRVRYKEKMIEAQKLYEKEESPVKKKEHAKAVSRYKNIQMAKKIQLNSAYGAIGNPHFRFFDLRQATAITLGGQLSIRWAENEINNYMNKMLKTEDVDYVIASDTDSLYINFEPLVHKLFNGKDKTKEQIITFLDKVASEKIEPVIDEIYQRLAVRTNSFSQKMNMKREVIADRAIWTAKKRYILNVWDSEGVRYKEPKLKIMGIEAVKSSTPSSCREAIKYALKLIMTGDEKATQEFIADFRNKFRKMTFQEIAFPRGMQGMNEYTLNSKSIPIHVRGALSFNQQLLNRKLTKKYELIRDGEKIKFCYLKLPNKTQHNVISAISGIPKEFELDSSIDYDTQFEKAFLQPIRSILSVINWQDTKINTLEDFF